MNTYTQLLTSGDGRSIPVYVAEPDAALRGAIVVVQEIFGVNSHIRAVTEGFAKDGYLAIAPHTFERVESGVELGYGSEDRDRGIALKAAVEALPFPGVMQDLQATVDWVSTRATGARVGVVGYCWGGLLAWRAACMLSGLSAAVPYYGGGMTKTQEIERQPLVPVLAHFAQHDASIPLDEVEHFRQAQSANGVRVELYPAHHGFNCDQRSAYDAPSAALARERTMAFFAEYLN